LRGSRIVQVGQRVTVYTLVQDRKILPGVL
jgi:hypothetical protein